MKDENGMDQTPARNSRSSFPWWFVAAMLFLAVLLVFIIMGREYNAAFKFIVRGLPITLEITALSILPALLIGWLVALACRSRFALFHNLGFLYLAVIGGIPTIIVIFGIAFVLTPLVVPYFNIESGQVSVLARGIIALPLAYSAIYGDAFRLALARREGAEPGNAQSSQRMRVWIAGGVTAIALFKDSSLLTFLAVPEIAHQARLFSGSTFQFRESYLAAMFLYLLISIPLRLIVERVEGRAGFR